MRTRSATKRRELQEHALNRNTSRNNIKNVFGRYDSISINNTSQREDRNRPTKCGDKNRLIYKIFDTKVLKKCTSTSAASLSLSRSQNLHSKENSSVTPETWSNKRTLKSNISRESLIRRYETRSKCGCGSGLKNITSSYITNQAAKESKSEISNNYKSIAETKRVLKKNINCNIGSSNLSNTINNKEYIDIPNYNFLPDFTDKLNRENINTSFSNKEIKCREQSSKIKQSAFIRSNLKVISEELLSCIEITII